MIRLALSTDAKGHPQHATLIASTLRRTSLPLHVRCWCRGFSPESFETGRLKVEFITTDEEVTGKFPGYVGPAVFDRLRVIRDAVDWDTCLIMDYDQLALCDLAPLFDLDLGDCLLAAKMQGRGVDMAYAMRTWIKRPLPEGWEHVAEYPYFSMGPLLNLKAMREAGTWDKLMAAHAAFGVDEQLSLTAATEGRTMGFDRKWNLFPKTDIRNSEVPEGVIHWLGWPKPWHPGANVWRPDIWEAEKSSWEHLRMGLWEKPLAVELEPEDDRGARALAQRGWRVEVFSSRVEDGGHSPTPQAGFPDLIAHPASREAFQKLLEREDGKIDQVRLGAWEDAADWLEGSRTAPEYLVLKGGINAAEADRVRALGYAEETRLMSGEWPAGGPLPRALDFHKCRPGTGIGPGEDLYLRMGTMSEERRPGDRLSFMAMQERPVVADAKRIGVCVIATAHYRMYVRPLLRSIRKNFLPGHEVAVFLFTDGDMEAAPDLRVIPVKHCQWPGMSLHRYAIFCEHAAAFEGMDYLFYLDADMRVIGQVGEEILSDLVGTLHPGFHDKPREKFTYERRTESLARVFLEEGTHYFCGGFQGGRTASYLQAARTMSERIEQDGAKGITAVWHDESHWNRYLIDHEPGIILSPSYCWYPDGRSKEFTPKISVVLKDAAEMRREDRTPVAAAGGKPWRFPIKTPKGDNTPNEPSQGRRLSEPDHSSIGITVDSMIAVIPAKSFSIRLPGKNMRPILTWDPMPLFEISYRSALAEGFAAVVTTDAGGEVAAYCEANGIPYVTEDVREERMEYAILNALGKSPLAEDKSWVVTLQPTSPIRSAGLLRRCMDALRESGKKSLITTTSLRPVLFHRGEPCFDLHARKITQETPPEDYYQYWNGNVLITEIGFLRDGFRLFDREVHLHEISMEEGHQIDNEIDFVICKALLEHQRNGPAVASR